MLLYYWMSDHLQSTEDVELPVNQIGNEGSEATAHAESISLLNTNHLSSSTAAPPTAECTSTPASLRMVDPIFSLFIQLCYIFFVFIYIGYFWPFLFIPFVVSCHSNIILILAYPRITVLHAEGTINSLC